MTVPLLLFLVLLVVIFVIGMFITLVDIIKDRTSPEAIGAAVLVALLVGVFCWGVIHAKSRTIVFSQPTISPADTDRKETP